MVDPRAESVALVGSRYEDWRVAFAAEQERLRDVLETEGLTTTCERIVHVGSTAVPDLAAKDIVDIDVVVNDTAVEAVSRAIVSRLGGDRFENSDGWHPVFREADGQRFNDHVFAVSNKGWKVSVVTRWVLAARPKRRAEYEQLKRSLAATHDDKQAYSEAKTEFISDILQTAREADDLKFDFDVPDSP